MVNERGPHVNRRLLRTNLAAVQFLIDISAQAPVPHYALQLREGVGFPRASLAPVVRTLQPGADEFRHAHTAAERLLA